MKKNLSPTVAAVIVILALLIAGYVWVKRTTPPPPVPGDPYGMDRAGGKGSGPIPPDVQELMRKNGIPVPDRPAAKH